MIQQKSSSLVWIFLLALHKYIFSWPLSSSFNCRQRKKILLSISLTPWKPSKPFSGKFLVPFHSVVKFSIVEIFLKKITVNFLLFNYLLGVSSTISIKIFLLLKKRYYLKESERMDHLTALLSYVYFFREWMKNCGQKYFVGSRLL